MAAMRGEVDAGRALLNQLVSSQQPPGEVIAEVPYRGLIAGVSALLERLRSAIAPPRCREILPQLVSDIAFWLFYITKLRSRYKDLIDNPQFGTAFADMTEHIWCARARDGYTPCVHTGPYFSELFGERSRSPSHLIHSTSLPPVARAPHQPLVLPFSDGPQDSPPASPAASVELIVSANVNWHERMRTPINSWLASGTSFSIVVFCTMVCVRLDLYTLAFPLLGLTVAILQLLMEAAIENQQIVSVISLTWVAGLSVGTLRDLASVGTTVTVAIAGWYFWRRGQVDTTAQNLATGNDGADLADDQTPLAATAPKWPSGQAPMPDSRWQFATQQQFGGGTFSPTSAAQTGTSHRSLALSWIAIRTSAVRTAWRNTWHPGCSAASCCRMRTSGFTGTWDSPCCG